MNREQAILLLWEIANAYGHDRPKAVQALRIIGMTAEEEKLAKALQHLKKNSDGYAFAFDELIERGLRSPEAAKATLEKWGFHE
ncbi:hypothetical protein SEA_TROGGLEHUMPER_67 [Rhodococcus phage Trogglehumper]|uniref:Uncharacterized protein n=1 Tax=Rhodococcus phage Trogglehumper TaxID=3038381 RepID=A0AAF0GLE7_9CAUD|nr:hypothetical protein SEA_TROGGLEHUMPER_67 [Rhodococcus phage Trogglehumper]